MSKHLKFSQQVACKDDDRVADGPEITLPIPPFPGLHVGALTIREVWVMQGESEWQSIGYEPVDADHMDVLLNRQNWTLDGTV